MPLNFPEIRRYGKLEFLARKTVEGFITGLHRSPYKGFSVEFAEHIPYNAGESTRHIDWKLYAKTGRLYQKRYEAETNLRCSIILDTSSSMYYPVEDKGKLKFSAHAAAALAWMLQRQRDAVGLTSFSEGIEINTPTKSTNIHINNIFHHLENILDSSPSQKPTNIVESLHKVAAKTPRRSLVVLFSDMFDKADQQDELFTALQHLKHNKHEILIFHVIDSNTEYNFDFEERPYQFTDIESGEKLNVTPSQVREDYKKWISTYVHELQLKCGQYGIDMIEVDCNKSLDQILLPYLVKRKKMG